MIDPFDTKNRSLAARLDRARFRTFLTMMIERYTAASWRLLTWFGLFAGLWLFQLPTVFGKPGAIITFIIFVLGAVYFTVKDFGRLRMPLRSDVDRRIELESKLKHRPLTAMHDTLANPEKSTTRRLWEIGKQHIFNALARAKSARPQAFMAEKDPYAARVGILMFFALGLYFAGPTWSTRIYNGLTPFHFERTGESPDRLTLWITPPAYTGLAPSVVKGKGDGSVIQIPEDSILKIGVRGGAGLPKLVTGELEKKFKAAEDGNYILETKILPGEELKIRQGFFTRVSWPYEIVKDNAPHIALKGMAEITTEGTMRFPMEVKDDYGVKNVIMKMTLNQSMSSESLGEPVSETRAVMSGPNALLPMQPVYDLTWHPWAGQPVSITFIAEDGNGQQAATEPVQITLPERQFQHPAAKALIMARKNLILKPTEQYAELGDTIEQIMIRPGLYLDDPIVFLALRSAASRLFWADPPSRETAQSTVSLLWDTAIRIEGGEISIAARNLRDTQRALENALENPDISQQEIAKLMSDLRSAMAQYMIEMQRELQKRMAEGQQFPQMSPQQMGQMIDPETLANFMEQLEARMMAGDQKAAQEMLAQLQRLMDMMDPSMAGPMPEDMQMMSEGLEKIQELLKRQKDLLAQTKEQLSTVNEMQDFGTMLPDETFPKDWNMDDLPPAPQAQERPDIVINTDAQAQEQEEIRAMLSELMQLAGEKLPAIPENMGMAEQEMRGASVMLGQDDPEGSIPNQEAAIRHLEQSQRNLSQQMMARMQQMTGFSMGSGMQFDPLGRPYGGNGNKNGWMGSPVKIPDEAERKKAQEILKELRKRSSELERPDEELDYYKRLLRQF